MHGSEQIRLEAPLQEEITDLLVQWTVLPVDYCFGERDSCEEELVATVLGDMGRK